MYESAWGRGHISVCEWAYVYLCGFIRERVFTFGWRWQCVSVCVSPCVPTCLCVPPVPVSGGLPGFRVHLPPSILHLPSVTVTDGSNGATGWGGHRTGETQRYRETETEALQVQGSESPAIHRLSNGSEQSQALLFGTPALPSHGRMFL